MATEAILEVMMTLRVLLMADNNAMMNGVVNRVVPVQKV